MKEFLLSIKWQLKLVALNIFSQIKTIWVLQPIANGDSCFIQTDSGRELFNVWTASSRCNTKLIWISSERNITFPQYKKKS